MLKNIFLFSLLLLLCFATYVSSQQTVSPDSKNPDGTWIRVQSDDGEFSIEVPEKYHYYFNKNGFSISELGTSNNYDLKKMRMLNSFVSGTLVSFECYETKKGAINVIYDGDIYKKADIEKLEIKGSGYSINQIVQKDKNYYLIRQYLYSKNNIYILTTASRNGETAFMKRFLSSLKFSPNVRQTDVADSTKLSSLQITDVEIELKLDEKISPPKKNTNQQVPIKNEAEEKFSILNKQRPAYTDSARMSGVVGTVVLRTTFSADGYVPKITVLRELPNGLLRQTLFAALRIKFLPLEKDGKAESVVKVIEYSFSIY